MNSTIKLYKNCLITPERLFKVDSIETYLSSLSGTLEYTNFQYVKHSLNTSIKIDMNQTGLRFQPADNYNYISIRNGTGWGTLVYYFIVDKKWIAEDTIQLFLSMDTINTFIGNSQNQGLVLSDRTKILRQHKDRYEKDGSKLWPIIDFYSEGFQAPLFGGSEKVLEDTSSWGGQNWYLVYRNQNEPSESLVNPVDCFLVPEREMYIDSYEKYHIEFSYYNLMQAFDDYPSSGGYNTTFWIVGKFNPTAQITLMDTHQGTPQYVIGLQGGTRSITITKINSTIYLTLRNEDGDPIGSPWEITASQNSFIDITNLYVIKYGNVASNVPIKNTYYMSNASINVYYNYTSSETKFYSDFTYIGGITAVDRTRSELIKIIEIPYCPISFAVSNSSPLATYTFLTSDWGTAYIGGIGGAIKLQYLEYDLEKQLSFMQLDDDNPFKRLDYVNSEVLTDRNKSMDFEPKLYHSDYYQPKLYYDSFGFIINLEKVTQYKGDYDMYEALRLQYRVSSTINSRFAFKVIDYVCENREVQDFNNLFVVARNNELPIYNQQFINYLRAGYNYEVKAKNRTEAMSWLGVGLSAIGSIASFASTPVTGGMGIATGVALATSTAGQIAGAVKTTIDAEQNFEAKNKQLQMQSTSVYGSDDVDLMEFYCSNRIRYKLYQVSERVKKALYDLFYYTGYIGNYLGVPDTTSRTRFNFVQCDPVFITKPNLPQEIVEDLIAKYQTGITFLHYYNNTWDFSQVKENWEVSLMGE